MPAGDRHRQRDRRGDGLVASVHSRRACRLENGDEEGENGDEEVKSIAADTEEVLLDDQDEAVDTIEIIDADIEKDDT